MDERLTYCTNFKKYSTNQEIRTLFREVLIDVHKQKLSNQTLKERKKLLLEKNLNKVLSDVGYKEAVGEINEQINDFEIERSTLREGETNIDHFIALVENILSNLALLWFESSFEDKLRFQSLVFPEGIHFDGKSIGTAVLGMPFCLTQGEQLKKTTLVHTSGRGSDFNPKFRVCKSYSYLPNITSKFTQIIWNYYESV